MGRFYFQDVGHLNAHKRFSNVFLNLTMIFRLSQLLNADNNRELLFASFSRIRGVTINFKLHVQYQ